MDKLLRLLLVFLLIFAPAAAEGGAPGEGGAVLASSDLSLGGLWNLYLALADEFSIGDEVAIALPDSCEVRLSVRALSPRPAEAAAYRPAARTMRVQPVGLLPDSEGGAYLLASFDAGALGAARRALEARARLSRCSDAQLEALIDAVAASGRRSGRFQLMCIDPAI